MSLVNGNVRVPVTVCSILVCACVRAVFFLQIREYVCEYILVQW